MSNDPWIVKEAKSNSPAPDGNYIAEFVGVEDLAHAKFDGDGVRWKWRWKVVSGEHANKVADRLTDRDVRPDATAGRVIKGLLGRDIQAGENVKAAIDACKGKRYMIAVSLGPKGGKSAVQHVGSVPTM